ncbi:MAG: nucleotidyltransferase [Bacteroidetes bacterium]|nr:nucleotidyltransferase [Bacteroidota bacterium]
MMDSPTLLILAAGMASRYGSLKQLDQFGPHGETIIDYSIYDALKAGFGKVVFVIRQSIEEEFKQVMLGKFAGKVAVDYVLQELGAVPEGFSVPPDRKKPWGTGHAVWVAAARISGPFAVINGDDFYGYQSFKLMAEFLKDKREQQFGLVGLQLENTLSEHGAVARGICQTDEHQNLISITEQTHIIRTARGIVAQDPERGEILLSGKETVSMNLMGFTPAVFPYIEAYFKEFLRNTSPGNIKAEFYLPEVVNKLVQSGAARVRVLPSAEKWFGVTFPGDKAVAIENLERLLASGLYARNLWAVPQNNH